MAWALPATLLLAVAARSEYIGQQHGWGGRETCIPGYDVDCNPTPAPAPVPVPVPVPVPAPTPVTAAPPPPGCPLPDLNSKGCAGNGLGGRCHAIFVPSKQKCVACSPTGRHYTEADTRRSSVPAVWCGDSMLLTTEAPMSLSTAPEEKCKLIVPNECVLPFTYKGLVYTTCTGVDAVETLWCSTDGEYAGHWKQCQDPCKNKWPAKKIASTVVAGSVAATGLGLMAAAIANNEKHGHFDPFFAFAGLKPVGSELTTPAPEIPVQGTTTVVEDIVIKPATADSPAVVEEVRVVPSELPTPENNDEPILESPVVPSELPTPENNEEINLESPNGRRLQSFLGSPASQETGPHPTQTVASQPYVAPNLGAQVVRVPVAVQVPVLVAAPPQITTTMAAPEASGHLVLLFVIIGIVVLFCGCIISLFVAHAAGFGKKRRSKVQSGGAGYPQGYLQANDFQ